MRERKYQMALAPLLKDQLDFDQNIIDFVIQQGLAPIWYENIYKRNYKFPHDLLNKLKQIRTAAFAQYTIQSLYIKKIRQYLDSIPHLIFKGAHQREILYSKPELRLAGDIDLLIQEKDKKQVIKILQKYFPQINLIADNISHEITLSNGQVDIDLHWHILRPGRCHAGLTTDLIQHRQDFGSHWGPCLEDTLFILLVHQAISKYLINRQSSLIYQWDLIQIIQKDLDWDRVYHRLKQNGLSTAAWISLVWIDRISGIKAPASFMSKIRPNRLKAQYLKAWLQYDLINRLPGLGVQIAFTLALHDAWQDVHRAIQGLWQAKKQQKKQLQALYDLIHH